MSNARATLLKEHFASKSPTSQPILTSLDGDSSWLLSFPRPAAERASSGKVYFHVVADPYLVSPAVFYSTWILTMHATRKPAVSDAAALEDVIREIEDAAAAAGFAPGGGDPSTSPAPSPSLSPVDAIFVNFHASDHMHEPTLRTFDRRIPVFAVPEAAATIRAWRHFDTVVTTGDLDAAAPRAWPALHPGGPLPPWLTVFRVPGHDFLHFVTVIVWTRQAQQVQQHEVILTAPHGARPDAPAVRAFIELCTAGAGAAETPMEVLALMHALKDSFTFGLRQTLGVAGGLALDEAARPRYWIRSHDAVSSYAGFVGKLTTDYPRTLEDGLRERREKRQADTAAGGAAAGAGPEEHTPNFVSVDSGLCFALT